MTQPDTSRSRGRPLSLTRLEAVTGTSFEGTCRQPSVYLVLDYSGSMIEGWKIRQARGGARAFADKALKAGYAVGLVQFATTPRKALSPQRTLDGFDAALNAWDPAGSTDMAAAIRLVVREFREFTGTKVMCLVTDGMPNHEGATLAAARDAKGAGIDIMAIGTDDADRAFLSKLTTRSELAVTVLRQEFHTAISSMALLLPAPGR